MKCSIVKIYQYRNQDIDILIFFLNYIYGGFLPLSGQDSRELTGKHCVEREGDRISKGLQDGNRTLVAVALYVGAVTTRLLVPTGISIFERYQALGIGRGSGTSRGIGK